MPFNLNCCDQGIRIPAQIAAISLNSHQMGNRRIRCFANIALLMQLLPQFRPRCIQIFTCIKMPQRAGWVVQDFVPSLHQLPFGIVEGQHCLKLSPDCSIRQGLSDSGFGQFIRFIGIPTEISAHALPAIGPIISNEMHETLIESLKRSTNLAADDLLLEGLRLGSEAEQALILEALLARKTVYGLSGVIEQFDKRISYDITDTHDIWFICHFPPP